MCLLDCGQQGLTGQRVRIDGLELTFMDVLVRGAWADGSTVSRTLRAQDTA